MGFIYRFLGRLAPIFKLVNLLAILGGAGLLALFAVHNETAVGVTLWPFTNMENPPTVGLGYLVIFVGLLYFLLGMFTTLLVTLRWKAQASQHSKDIKQWKQDKAAQREAEVEALAITGIETGKGRDLAITQQ